MKIAAYLSELSTLYRTGKATEHTYRPALATLLQGLLPKLVITNEPKRQACGAPDYILTLADLPIGFVEAKDIGDNDLKGEKIKGGNKEQFDRYKKSLDNLIFTDYLTFHFYRGEELLHSVTIGKATDKGIVALAETFELFLTYIQDFGGFEPSGIAKADTLVTLMARKAKLLSQIIEKALTEDSNQGIHTDLTDQLSAFREILIHDISIKDFADVYAQTITYGLFTARYHDPTLPTFSRAEAYQLLPKSNPFLKKLFGYIAGMEVDTRISWVVDDLVQLYLACDVAQMLASYGQGSITKDPIIHFYEDFLEAYDPKLRKDLGVWYTPLPVVTFMVRAVDALLKKAFALPQGLADTSKVKVQIKQDGKIAGYDTEEREFHRVQILDPATGTGTFLAEIVKHIAGHFAGQQGLWQGYVREHLLPRLNGFELLMASYAIAHLKLDILLNPHFAPQEREENRIQVYLTNSLEEAQEDKNMPFARWLAEEANEANRLKRDTPVMCIIGNPPYNGESTNKGKWIMGLMNDYKKEPNTKIKLAERNTKWINDDYVKFIRLGEYFVSKNGSGLLAYITPHGFLDNPTFRGMRWHLLKTFDCIYTLDLHGNSRKKETTPDGEADQNVFDIMQGVAITIFVKTPNAKLSPFGGGTGEVTSELAQVFHYDLWGKRAEKFAFLEENTLEIIPFTQVNPTAPNYFFVPKDNSLLAEYEQGFSIAEFFKRNSVGVVTGKDSVLIDTNKQALLSKVKEHYDIIPEIAKVKEIAYRPFDTRYIYWDIELVTRHRSNTMQHFIKGENIGLVVSRANRQLSLNYMFVTKDIADLHILDNAADSTYTFPLYLYLEGKGHFKDAPLEKTPNLNPEILKALGGDPQVAFDYCYGVLHSKNYREKYKEFLKIDFPRIPYPKNEEDLHHYASIGKRLRELHLLESPEVQSLITTYPVAGNNVVENILPSFGQEKVGSIYIDENQYFGEVPLLAWEAYIGGYQPAQKWLKDRKGITLSYEDIMHYQRLIKALLETENIINS
ncbi:MAG: N-6 DNA methylase [Capnocytophaga sp.]|nr:N-6 DNA methylase [Capnocytophaga sp.]